MKFIDHFVILSSAIEDRTVTTADIFLKNHDVLTKNLRDTLLFVYGLNQTDNRKELGDIEDMH